MPIHFLIGAASALAAGHAAHHATRAAVIGPAVLAGHAAHHAARHAVHATAAGHAARHAANITGHAHHIAGQAAAGTRYFGC